MWLQRQPWVTAMIKGFQIAFFEFSIHHSYKRFMSSCDPKSVLLRVNVQMQVPFSRRDV